MSEPQRSATDWITSFAEELGVDAPTDSAIEILLDLAGVAAHSSERIAAPIACYLLGVAGQSPEDGLVVAKRVAEVAP